MGVGADSPRQGPATCDPVADQPAGAGTAAGEPWPTALPLVWVVVFLVAYWLWAYALRRLEYRYDLFDGLFLAAVALWLVWQRRASDIRAYFVGRLLPGRRRLPLVGLLLAATPVAMYALAWVDPGRTDPLTPLSVLLSVVVGPLHEEVVFRGVLLAILLGHVRGPRWAVVLLSALLFASCHGVRDWFHAVWLTTLGVLTGAAYAYTRSVPVCFAIHAFWNALARCPFVLHAA